MSSNWGLSPPKLECFPAELIDEICKNLGARDISSLRLANRALSRKALYEFGNHHEYKNVYLTVDALNEFIYETRTNRFARRLKHLTIHGYAYCNRRCRRMKQNTRKTSQEEYLLPILVKAFRNLLEYSSGDFELSSLSLRVLPVLDIKGTTYVPAEFLSYQTISETAARTFAMTMKALKQTRMPVRDHLDIFGGVKGCSLRYDAFLNFARLFANEKVEVFRSVKRLTVSLSVSPKVDKILPVEDSWNTNPQMWGYDFAQRRCVARVLYTITHDLFFMPELEDLDFEWYTLPLRDEDHKGYRAARRRAPLNMYSGPPLTITNLKKCTLRGIYVSAQVLVNFIKVVRPTTLTLEHACLVSGNLGTVLRYLLSQDSGVESYHLDDILWGDRLIHYPSLPGEPKFRSSPPESGPSTLSREGTEAKQVVQYRVSRNRPVRNSQWEVWNNTVIQDFGTIVPTDYDFMKWNQSPIYNDPRKKIGAGRKSRKRKIADCDKNRDEPGPHSAE